MAAPVDLVEVDELGVGPLGPAPRGAVQLIGEDSDGGRDVDVLGGEEVERVLPVQPGGGNLGVRSASRTSRVEDFVPGQVADAVTREGVGDVLIAGRVVIDHPGGQAGG